MNATGVSYVPNGVLYVWLDMQIIHHLDGYVPFKSIYSLDSSALVTKIPDWRSRGISQKKNLDKI